MDNMNICDMCGFVAKTKKKFTQHKKLMTLVLFHVTSAKRISQGCSH